MLGWRPLLGASVVQGRAAGMAGHPNILGLMSTVVILVWLERSSTAEPHAHIESLRRSISPE